MRSALIMFGAIIAFAVGVVVAVLILTEQPPRPAISPAAAAANAPEVAARDEPPAKALDPRAAELARRRAVCRAGEPCRTKGACDYVENSFGWIESFDPDNDCVATALGCAACARCRIAGHCTLDDFGNGCIIGRADCAGSTGCTESGLCALVRDGPETGGGAPDFYGRRCRALNPEHCQRGALTKAEGRSCASNGVCVKPDRRGRCP